MAGSPNCKPVFFLYGVRNRAGEQSATSATVAPLSVAPRGALFHEQASMVPHRPSHNRSRRIRRLRDHDNRIKFRPILRDESRIHAAKCSRIMDILEPDILCHAEAYEKMADSTPSHRLHKLVWLDAQSLATNHVAVFLWGGYGLTIMRSFPSQD